MLEAAGSGLDRALKTTVFLTDLGTFGEMNDVYGRHLTAPYPARSTIEVSALPGRSLGRDRVHRRARLEPDLVGNSKLEVFLIVLPIFIGSLTLHELAHGLVAYRLGDPTAKLMGRLSLNPIVHLDPLGSLFFVASYWVGGFLFGWARPVPVDPRNLRDRPAARDGAGRDRRTDHELPARDPVRRDRGARELHGHGAGGPRSTPSTSTSCSGSSTCCRSHRSTARGSSPDSWIARTYAAWASLDQYGMVILLILFFVFQGPFTTLLQHATSDVAAIISDIVGGTPIVV